MTREISQRELRNDSGAGADLLIASIAAANRLPLYTGDPTDFAGLDSLISVITV